MKNLMTRKLVFGVLMAFVLALGVQGVCEALTLTPVSDRVQSKLANSTFEITFRVGLKAPAIAYNAQRKQITDHNTPASQLRIDSQGHRVGDLADGRSLRVIHTTPGYIPSAGTQVILTNNQQPQYATQPYTSSTTGDPPTTTYTIGAATLNLPTATPTVTYVDASGYAYTATGVPVYVQSNTGARDDPGTAANENDPYAYVRLRALPLDVITEADRFDFNEEQITITSTEPGGTTAKPITLRDKRDGQPVLEKTNAAASGTMSETSFYTKLMSSVTLVTEPLDEGTYVITITDSTPDDDFPVGQVPVKQSITFTLYVQTDETPTAALTFADSAAGNLKTLSTTLPVVPISTHFTFPATPVNLSIRYQVAVGSGRVYPGTPDREDRTPVRDLTIHKDSAVYLKTNGTTNEVIVVVAGQEPRTHGKTIVFEYSGSAPTRDPDPRPPTNPVVQPTTRTLSLSPSTLSGAPNTPVPLTASVSPAVAGVPVTFFLNQVALSQVSTNAAGQAPTTIILPTTSGGSIVAAASGYTSATASISLTTTPTTPTPEPTPTVLEPASIQVYDGDDQDGELNRRLPEDLVVEVLDRNNRGVSFEIISLRVVEGSGRFSPSRPRTGSDGTASFSFTPRSAGSQGVIEIEASVGGLPPAIFTVNVGEPPSAIFSVSGNNQSGRPGQRLANPFVVEVVDDNDDPVSGVSVSFAVTAGGGTLSDTSETTNNGGRAQTTLTLGDAIGDNTVQARVTGLRAVTFTASAGATVLVDSDKRAPMYWVAKQKGTLHRLVDGEVEDLAPAVTGVTSIAVDSANNLLYFAVQTGNNKGAIRRSSLNGRNAQTIKALTAVPMGIAVDSAGGTVYWTNSRGRIQSIAAEGSAKLTNLLSNLANPMPIAVSNGHVYWGEPLGSRIRRASLTSDRITPENIATGVGEPVSIAIAKGKVYWIERNGGGGKLQRANLDGSGIQQIKTFASGVPSSLAIDSSDNKIYWTRSTGKIQRSNLAGKFTTDIVSGLMGPGSIALGIAAAADDAPVVRQTPTTPRTPTTPTTPTDNSKYDVNGDGAVDNIDLTLVAIAIGTSNAQFDVNGDGVVNADDVRAVSDAISDAAAAPAIDIDLKAMDLDFDRIQEQVEMLLSSGDLSINGQRVLIYLQHLLASARPDATVLLTNYPNPFNPETWIPYHLAGSTDVKVRIYDARGTLVRELTLGHQSAGYYTSRSRAAYWDGRNALGERVASGIYFYQLQTDELSPLRKMVILK